MRDPGPQRPRQTKADLVGLERALHNLRHSFKRPREIYLVRELPRSTLRKVDKVELRAVADPAANRADAEKRWIAESSSDPSGEEQ
jgi:crotonobetaine/carnitine-CoA ligase